MEVKMSNRTDELRDGGARDRTASGTGTPFVKWGEHYSWVEGQITKIWEGKFGLSATTRVTAVSNELFTVGKGENGEKVTCLVTPDTEVNIGLNYAALDGAIVPGDEGKHVHVAFEGWQESKTGDRYRLFAVLEMPDAGDRNEPELAEDKSSASSDGLPF
jgi:hypothetical protein